MSSPQHLKVGQAVVLCRRGRVQFRATVQRVVRSTREAILSDVRRLDGRLVMARRATHAVPLVLRANGRAGTVIGQGGFGGELLAEVDEWDH